MPATSPDREQLQESVMRVVAEEFAVPRDSFTPSSVLLHIEGADSVKQMRATARLEDEFEVLLMSEDLPPARQVQDLVDQLAQALSDAAPASPT